MRWVDALVDCSEAAAVATVRIGEEHFALCHGVMLETALVECVAQTVAAAFGMRMSSGGTAAPAIQGMLVAASNFKIAIVPQVGWTLTVETRELKRFGSMLLVASTVTCDGRLVATGELTLYA